MDMLSTTQALELLRERGLDVSYPTVARWVSSGLFKGAERVQETRGPVWKIPRAAVLNFTPPKPTGRPPKPQAPANSAKKGARKPRKQK